MPKLICSVTIQERSCSSGGVLVIEKVSYQCYKNGNKNLQDHKLFMFGSVDWINISRLTGEHELLLAPINVSYRYLVLIH